MTDTTETTAAPRKRRASRKKPEQTEQPEPAASKTTKFSLAEMSAAPAEDTKPLTHTIDVSMFLTDTPTFEIRNLAVYELFRVRKEAREFMVRNPTWTDECALVVATLAMTHTAPALPCPKGIFYEGLANSSIMERATMFAYLLLTVQQIFPHLINFDGEVEAAKKNSKKKKRTT